MARPKNGDPGNGKGDQKFFEEYAHLLKPIDPDPDDPYGKVRFVWTGKEEDVGSPWQVPPEGKRCAGNAFVRDAEGQYVTDEQGERLKRPCTRWPIKGGPVCIGHGGGHPGVRAAALGRMMQAVDAITGALIDIALDRGEDGKVRVQAMNSLLDRAGLKAHSAVEMTVSIAPYETLLKKWAENGVLDDGGS